MRNKYLEQEVIRGQKIVFRYKNHKWKTSTWNEREKQEVLCKQEKSK